MDYHSVKKLKKKFPGLVFLVPLGLKKWFSKIGINEVVEVDWWEKHQLDEKITVVATPSQHWSCRHLWKQNDSLWNSWVVLGTSRKLFFAGDTSYCPVFRQIGKMYGPFDISFLPIGSYCPRESQKISHIDPGEAVQVHQDIGSKLSIGMHFGTFQFTNVFFKKKLKSFIF